MKENNQKQFVCENPRCGKIHDGSYGSGRFCSDHCRRVYAGKMTKNHVCNFKDHNKRRAPYGTWTCQKCGQIFRNRKELYAHFRQHGHICQFCNSVFDTGSKLGNHMLHCKKNPRYLENKKSIANKISKLKRGIHLSREDRDKKSIAAIAYRRSLSNDQFHGFSPSYNKRSIVVLEALAKEHGWNFQHAENGGEFYVGGYFVDAYDKERNIVLEYDEPRHYIDVDNNILVQKDVQRQNFIINRLGCQFFRYNEKTKVLWKVN